jgi:uncharacterized cupredoxin-like copper-binding protein
VWAICYSFARGEYDGPLSTLNPRNTHLEKPGIYVLEAVNSGKTTHALEVEGEGIEEFSDEIQPGERTKLRVDLKPGTYGLTCPVDGHEDKGMETTITVNEG